VNGYVFSYTSGLFDPAVASALADYLFFCCVFFF